MEEIGEMEKPPEAEIQMFLDLVRQHPKPVRAHILELLKRKDLTTEQKVELVIAQLREKRSEEETVPTTG